MSFLNKKWIIQNQDENLNLVEKLLKNRQITDQKTFFSEDVNELHDSFLMKGMKVAVDRIGQAIRSGEKIMIFGDYDVDGTSGTAVLYLVLKMIGADVYYKLPHREKDGYGPKDYLMEEFAEMGIKLVITVDCGTSALHEIKVANKLGMEVIVTDHHSLPEVLPNALAILNPHQPDCEYPNKHLSGSGVAFKLITALLPLYLDANQVAEVLYEQLGIATLGLVADCMPLIGENRILVTHGLRSLETGSHPGIRSLLESAGAWGKPVTSQTIGFVIGPRINAAGRLDSADHALELLLGDTKKVEVLNQLNVKRQQIVEGFIEEAKARVESLTELPLVIVLSDPNWMSGVLGLIAGKLCEHFGRPVIAMQEKENELVGSCRSLNEFDITGFLREHAEELFITMGGHAMAGGFTISRQNVKELKSIIKENAPKYIDPKNFFGKLEVDCLVSDRDLSLRVKEELDILEPFGQGNPQPVLAIQNVQISDVRPVGKNGNHLQLPLFCGNQQIQSIAFRFGEHAEKINPELSYDIAFNLDVNEWNGRKNVQLKVVDIRESE